MTSLSRGILWHVDPNTCPHFNDHVCPTCDFDGYYESTYVDCPWRTPEPPAPSLASRMAAIRAEVGS